MYRNGVRRRPAASAVRSSNAATLYFDGFQRLEPRTLFSLGMAFEGLVNTAKFPGNQSETAIAINPANTNQVFISSNFGSFVEPDQGPNDPIAGDGIFTTFSLDGGATWTPRVIAAGTDTFPVACCDPSASFDQFGNLFFVYLAGRPGTAQGSEITVLLSTDGGQTFANLINFRGGGSNPLDPNDLRGGVVDRCEVTTGPLPDGSSMVAVSFVDFDTSVDCEQTVMAHVTGLGAAAIAPWGPVQSLPQSGPGNGAPLPHNIAHVQIGPNGQVTTAHQEVGQNPVDRIFVNTDPDGLGPLPFGNAVLVDVSQLTFFEPLPGQPVRGVSAVPTLAYDRSTGPHRGRLYIAYAQADTEQRTDTLGFPIGVDSDSNIMLRFSDDNGATWSPPIRVNDDPVSLKASQFFQRVSVDPTTGNVGVGWLDSRDDTNGQPNDEIGYYATVGQATGTGVAFEPNMRLNVGESNARFSGNFGNDYGDYTALDFYGGVLRASWPDNSNSTGDNPSGRLRAFDIYEASVRVTDTTVPTPPFVTPASPLSPTVSNLQSLVKKGKFYQLAMTYSHPSGIDLATVSGDDLLVTGPNGFSQFMQLVKAKPFKKKTVVGAKATYRVAAPGGTWDEADNGVYTVTLQAGAVSSADHTVTTAAGTLTRFNVNAKPAKAASSRKSAPSSMALMAGIPVFGNMAILSKKDHGGELLGLLD